MISGTLEKKIIDSLPYGRQFLFVDSVTNVSENEIIGTYAFQKNETFYQGHFPEKPITPGVILVETMAQIGLVCFGIYLLHLQETRQEYLPFLSHIEADLILPVYPGETVSVQAQKVYFRNNILKCKIKMINYEVKTVVIMTGICNIKFISK
ncbi:MAG: hydroxymyristoyl-ACP dehydratase [Bacteroidota bacterium]